MPRARYHDAIDWIARNDGESLDVDEIAATNTVRLTGVVWDRPPESVAAEVSAKRRRLKAMMLCMRR